MFTNDINLSSRMEVYRYFYGLLINKPWYLRWDGKNIASLIAGVDGQERCDTFVT